MFSPENLLPIYQPLTQAQAKQIIQSDFLLNCQLECGFQIDQGIQVVFTLTPQYIYLTQGSGLIWRCPLSFAIKLQILHTDKYNPHSKVNAFKIISQQHSSSIVFYSSNKAQVSSLVLLLSQKLNIIGFHQYFRGVKKLGQGSFAQVYKICHKLTGQMLAAKAFPKKNFENNQKQKKDLIKQIQILRTINSYHILNLKSVFESQNTLYVATQLLSGGTLKDRIGQIDQENTRQIMFNLLLAINELKEKGICHRDIKLQNIVMRDLRSLTPVLVDLGLATYYSTDKKPNLDSICGTIGYVAPQAFYQANWNTSLSEKRDIFSLGVIFHILLLKSFVFQGEGMGAVIELNKLCNIDFTKLKYLNMHPKALNLLKKMLERNPEQRISCEEALKDQYFEGLSKIQFTPAPQTVEIQFCL